MIMEIIPPSWMYPEQHPGRTMSVISEIVESSLFPSLQDSS